MTTRTPIDDVLTFLLSSYPARSGFSAKIPALLRTPGLEAAFALAEKAYALGATERDLAAYRAEIERAPLSAATRARLLVEAEPIAAAIQSRLETAAAAEREKAEREARGARRRFDENRVATEQDLAWLRSWLPDRRQNQSMREIPDPAVAAHLEAVVTGGVPIVSWARAELQAIGATYAAFLGEWRVAADAPPRDHVRVRALSAMFGRLYHYRSIRLSLDTNVAALTRRMSDERIARLLAPHGGTPIDDHYRTLLRVSEDEREGAAKAEGREYRKDVLKAAAERELAAEDGGA